MKKTRKFGMGGGMPTPMAKPMEPMMGLKPQFMGGSSDKMGPGSVRTGTPVPPRPPTPTPRPMPAPKPAPKPAPTPRPMPAPTAPTNNVGIGKFEQDQFNKLPAMMKKGGAVKASKRADGCAVRGKTKGRMV